MAKTTPFEIDCARAVCAAFEDALEEATVLRFMYGLVDQARCVASELGPDDPDAWDLAAVAADLELDALNWELGFS